MKKRPQPANARTPNLGDEMIAGMKELIAVIQAGGLPAAKKQFTTRRVQVAPSSVAVKRCGKSAPAAG